MTNKQLDEAGDFVSPFHKHSHLNLMSTVSDFKGHARYIPYSHELFKKCPNLPAAKESRCKIINMTFRQRFQLKHGFTLTSPLITPWETKMPAAASVPLFQLGCYLFARLHAISSILKAQLQCDKLCCNLSAWLQLVSSAASCQGSRDFSSSARLQTVSLAATVPTKCAFVNSAVHIQPSCNLSALP